jgi:opacity protein-like surface antigen
MAVRKSLLVALSILLCVLLLAPRASAGSEGYVDLYLGGAGNWSADVNVSERTSSGTTAAAASIDLTSSTEFGVRFGVWHPTYDWVGMGMDLGYFQADGPGVDITGFPMTLFLSLRAPLFPTPDRPGGRLQPYVMAGVSFYITDITVLLDGMGGSSFQSSWPWPNTSSDFVVGPYLAAGLAWQPTKRLAIFGEYRYSSFDLDYDTTNSIFFPTANGRVETTIRSDRLLFGLSYRFGTDAPKMEAQR